MPYSKPTFHLSMLAACLVSLSAHAADDDLLSRDALFGDDLPKLTSSQNNSGTGIKGFIQFEAARTIAEPEHWSKLRSRAELGTSGKLGDSMKWKVGARFDYDFAYAINDFYPSDVEKNQRHGIELRENYLDYSYGNWDFRFGKQHVVWGEMVGLFFADVVSARDLREFVLPEFDQMRIPQWAVRAEYFARQVAKLQPDLIILSMGTNEAQGHTEPGFMYRTIRDLTDELLKHSPHALIMLTTPADSYLRGKGFNPYMPDMSGVIRKFAREKGYAMWDLFNYTGGANSAINWKSSGLMSSDSVHYSKAGYAAQGKLLYQSLVKGYNEYVLAKEP